MTVTRQIALAEKIASLLDTKFKIGPFRFGLDPVLGLFPWIGDVITLAVSTYLIVIGYRNGVKVSALMKMAFYAGADFFIGSFPIIGDVADFFFKASTINLKILKEELGVGTVVPSKKKI